MQRTSFSLRILLSTFLSLSACGVPSPAADEPSPTESTQALVSPAHCADPAGCLIEAPVTHPIIYRFWGASANDVWAVGKYGRTMHWNGTTWQRIPTPAVGYDLRAVWGSSASNVWAVGDGATLLHWKGTSWVTGVLTGVGTITGGFNDVWGTSANDVWAVTDGGDIIHYNGTAWTRVGPTPYINGFMTVWGASANNVWIGGEAGILLHWDGTNLNEVASGSTDTVWRIRGTSTTNAFMTTDPAFGMSGIRRWNGTSWSAPATDAAGEELWVVSDGTAWLFTPSGSGGGFGTAYHWNGTAWSHATFPLNPIMATAVWATATDGWYCDSDGTMLRYNGTSWVAHW